MFGRSISNFEEKNESIEISSKPNLMILFNPGLISASTKSYKISDAKEKLQQIAKLERKSSYIRRELTSLEKETQQLLSALRH